MAEKFKGYLVERNEDNKWDISFSLQDPTQEIPELNLKLYQEVEITRSAIIEIFKNDEEKKELYFDMLLTLAQGGLAGESANLTNGILALKILKEEILMRESGRYKNLYIRKLGKTASIYILILFVIYIIPFVKEIKCYTLIFIGSMVGNWLSFCIRKLDIDFEDLISFEKDKMEHHIRLIFIGIISIVFAMFLKAELLNISIGSIQLKDFLIGKEKNLLLGIMVGILDTKIATDLYSKVDSIFNKND